MKEQQLKSAFDNINETYSCSMFEGLRDERFANNLIERIEPKQTYTYTMPYDDPFEEL